MLKRPVTPYYSADDMSGPCEPYSNVVGIAINILKDVSNINYQTCHDFSIQASCLQFIFQSFCSIPASLSAQ